MRGIPVLAAAYGIAAVANLLLSITVGRTLGAAGLGTFALAVALARIFYAGTDLGLATHLTREVAKHPGLGAPRTALFLAFRTLLIPCATVVVVAAGLALGHRAPWCFALVAIALGLVTLQGLFEAVLLAHQRARDVAILTTLTSIAIAGACGVAAVTHVALTWFAALYAGGMAVAIAAWAAWTGTRLGVWPRWVALRGQLGDELARSWRIGASTLLAIAALRAPTVVLSMFGSPADVGTFAAVDTLVTAPGILQVAVTNASFPRLAASFRADPAAYAATFWRSNALLAAAGLVLGGGLALAGSPLLAVLLPSQDFAGVAELMPIAACSLPGLLLVHHNVALFAAAERERSNLKLMVGWFTLIAIAQLALVPWHGVLGAAWGLVIARTVGIALLVAAIASTGIHRGLPPE